MTTTTGKIKPDQPSIVTAFCFPPEGTAAEEKSQENITKKMRLRLRVYVPKSQKCAELILEDSTLKDEIRDYNKIVRNNAMMKREETETVPPRYLAFDPPLNVETSKKLLDFMKTRLSLVLDEQVRPHVMTLSLDSCKVDAANKRSGARSGELSIEDTVRDGDERKRVRKYQRATRFEVDGELSNIILTVEIPDEDSESRVVSGVRRGRRRGTRGSTDLWITVYEPNQGAAFTMFVTAAQHDILRAKMVGRNEEDSDETFYKEFCVSTVKATHKPTLHLSFNDSALEILDDAGLRRG